MCRSWAEVLHKKPFSGLISEENRGKTAQMWRSLSTKGRKTLSGSDFDPCQSDFNSCAHDPASCGSGGKAPCSFPVFPDFYTGNFLKNITENPNLPNFFFFSFFA